MNNSSKLQHFRSFAVLAVLIFVIFILSWKQFGLFSAKRQLRFKDVRKESGILFRYQPTKDSAKNIKFNHYLHGSGILAADVDNDGRTDVYFLNQVGKSRLYRNIGDGKFQDITDISGTGLEDKISIGGSFADIDNDGDEDLFVATVRGGNALLENDGKGLFTDITRKAGVEYFGHSSASIFFDFNNDGLLDFFLVNTGRFTTDKYDREENYWIGAENAHLLFEDKSFSESSILYKNLGNKKFKDVTEEVGLNIFPWPWTGDGAITDYSSDGYADMYIGNIAGDDLFFKNVGGKYFEETTSKIFPKTSYGTMGIKFFDYNNDSLIDLLTTDMHSDMEKDYAPDEEKLKLSPEVLVSHGVKEGTNNILGNAFYKNAGSGRWEEISDEIGVETYWPWGASVEDVNADGYLDIFVSSGMGYLWRHGKNVLLMNEEGQRFRNAEYEVGIEPRNDGDIINDYFALDCRGQDRQRSECSKDYNKTPSCREKNVCYRDGFVSGSKSSRSSVIFDMDDDGDLDIITNEFNDYPLVLESDLARQGHANYLKVKPVGRASNKDAVGALVTIFYEGKTQTRYIDAKSGYLSQSQLPLYFGLGDYAGSIDKIQIRWPSGISQVLESVSVNSTVHITEPES